MPVFRVFVDVACHNHYYKDIEAASREDARDLAADLLMVNGLDDGWDCGEGSSDFPEITGVRELVLVER